METPFITTFDGIDRSDALDADIQKRFARLGTYCPSILGGRVLVERAGNHHREGNRFHVRITVLLPGEHIIVEHKTGGRPATVATEAAKARKQDEVHRGHMYAGVAVREAFEAARRQLQDHMTRLRREVKAHTPPPKGRVVRLFPSKAHGFLEAEDGHEVYFDKGSVRGDAFDALEVGTRVVFAEARSASGPRASTVRVNR